jgi:polysaccharide deacetylase 2 family uncharacterized protein YibQ
MTAVQSLQHYTSTKAFRAGLGVAGAVYLLLFAYAWISGGKSDGSDKLATQIVDIIREKTADEPPETKVGDTATETSPIISPTETAETMTDNARTQADWPMPDVDDVTDESDQAVASPSTTATMPATTAPVTTRNGIALNAPVALPRAPIDGLSEDAAGGHLPKIRDSDRLSPFEAYRRPAPAIKPGMPTVSIGVVDFGLSGDASKQALSDLSPDVSMVMTPYTTSADYWVGEARNNGHEVWLELPVETDLYPRDDSGPQTLLISAIERINMNKLTWIMSQAQGYVGLVTPYQPAFMKSENDVRPVMNEIYGRGLGFVDGSTSISPPPQKFSYSNGAIYRNTDAWIDIPSTPEHMAAALRQLEVAAQSGGSAIGMIHSTPEGLKALQTWIDGLPQKNIAITPLSAQLLKAK